MRNFALPFGTQTDRSLRSRKKNKKSTKKVAGNKKRFTFALPFEQRIVENKKIGLKIFFKKVVGNKKKVYLCTPV